MAHELNATCAICGNRYYKCISCKSFMSLNPWKVHTDTSEHYKIYQILHGYSVGVYTKKEAKAKLQLVDLSDFEILRDNIKNVIRDILDENEKITDDIVENKSEKILANKTNISNKNNFTRKTKSYKNMETE